MASSLRRSRYFLLSAALAASALLTGAARAQFAPPTLTINAPSGLISWNAAVDRSSPTAVVTYILYSRFGLNVNALSSPSAISSTTQTSLPIGNLSGRLSTSECFVLQSSDTVSGVFATSLNTCHSYLHTPGGGNVNSILRSDALGQQLGFGQLWNLSYFLDDDSYVTLRVYPPGETFTTNAVTGLVTPNNNLPVTATVVGGVPRSGELNGGGSGFAQNQESWNISNSSGVVVPNGIYYAYFSVTDSFGTLQYADSFTIPVNDIRFTAFSTTGISPTVATANINYTVTANCNFRAVIAKPGRTFTIDANGLVQALDQNGSIDTSTNSVIAVISGQRNYNTNTETWNGLNSLGVAVSTGVYPVGISALDLSGNRALDLNGNNGPVSGSIAVDRIPPAPAPSGTAPNVSAISIGGTSLSLSGGTAVTAFSAINITLTATGGPATTVTLTGPNGPVAGGVVSVSGTAVTYSTTSVLASTGAYTVTVSPYDQSGANPGTVQTTPFTLQATPGPSVTAISVGGTPINLAGGTAVAPGFVAISVTLSANAGTNSTVSLIGPLGAVAGGSVSVSGAVVTYSTGVAISTTGAYSVTVTPIDSTNTNLGPVKTVAFTIQASASGGAGGNTQSNALLAASVVPFPNPVKTAPAAVNFTLAAQSTVDIDIYTLTGQHVLHQTKSYLAGPNTFLWNLANDAGSGIANGVYIFHLRATNALGTVKASKKLMVVK